MQEPFRIVGGDKGLKALSELRHINEGWLPATNGVINAPFGVTNTKLAGGGHEIRPQSGGEMVFDRRQRAIISIDQSVVPNESAQYRCIGGKHSLQITITFGSSRLFRAAFLNALK